MMEAMESNETFASTLTEVIDFLSKHGFSSAVEAVYQELDRRGRPPSGIRSEEPAYGDAHSEGLYLGSGGELGSRVEEGGINHEQEESTPNHTTSGSCSGLGLGEEDDYRFHSRSEYSNWIRDNDIEEYDGPDDVGYVRRAVSHQRDFMLTELDPSVYEEDSERILGNHLLEDATANSGSNSSASLSSYGIGSKNDTSSQPREESCQHLPDETWDMGPLDIKLTDPVITPTKETSQTHLGNRPTLSRVESLSNSFIDDTESLDEPGVTSTRISEAGEEQAADVIDFIPITQSVSAEEEADLGIFDGVKRSTSLTSSCDMNTTTAETSQAPEQAPHHPPTKPPDIRTQPRGDDEEQPCVAGFSFPVTPPAGAEQEVEDRADCVFSSWASSHSRTSVAGMSDDEGGGHRRGTSPEVEEVLGRKFSNSDGSAYPHAQSNGCEAFSGGKVATRQHGGEQVDEEDQVVLSPAATPSEPMAFFNKDDLDLAVELGKLSVNHDSEGHAANEDAYYSPLGEEDGLGPLMALEQDVLSQEDYPSAREDDDEEEEGVCIAREHDQPPMEQEPSQSELQQSAPSDPDMPRFVLDEHGALLYEHDQQYIDRKYEVFDLKIIHRRQRTGFEENKDFPIRQNDLIAGRYQVMDFLGSAAFSRAVQALDLQTGSLVCLKIIKNNKDYLDQSLDEIKLLRYVNGLDPHDEHNIVRLYDFFYYKEHLFLVCELLRANLYEFQKYNKESGDEIYFTLPRIQRIAVQVLQSLAFLHSLGLIHSDLKPENILIKSYSKCQVKVIDLGSSCFITDHLSSYVQSRSYRAPEVILGLPYNQKIDIWSLGCILAELYTGLVLFQNESLATLLARMEGILGPTPEWMITEGRYSHRYFTQSKQIFDRSPTGLFEILQPKKTCLKARLAPADDGFVDFLDFLLQVNPRHRPSAVQALRHPWLQYPYPPVEAVQD